MMRKSVIVPLTLFIVGLVTGLILFRDQLLRWTLVGAGEKIFHAKVEVVKTHIGLSPLSVEISTLAVADKDDVWKNLFQFSRARFAIRPGPLLSGKFIVEEMAVEDIRSGTKRTTSGELPPRKLKRLDRLAGKEEPSAMSRLAGQMKDRTAEGLGRLPQVARLANLAQELKGLSVDRAITVADLQSPKAMDDMKQDLLGRLGKMDEGVAGLKVDEKARGAEQAVKAASEVRVQGPQDLPAARETLGRLQTEKANLESTVGQVHSIRENAKGDLALLADLPRRIEDLKNQDLGRLKALFKLDLPSTGDLARAIIGPAWIGRMEKLVHYVGLARKYMPARKPSAVVARPRFRGRDIQFPTPALPTWWVKKVSLSGAAGEVALVGAASDLTGDPQTVGKPAVMNLSGKKGEVSLTAAAILDHVTDVPHDVITLAYTGAGLAGVSVVSQHLPPIDKGRLAVESRVELAGDGFEAQLRAKAAGVEWRVLPGLGMVTADARAKSTAAGLDLKVSSNLDSWLAGYLKSLAAGKIKELEARLRAEVDTLTAGKREEILRTVQSRDAEVRGRLQSAQSQIEGKIAEVRAQADALEKRIRDQAAAQAERAQKELKAKEGEIKQQGEQKIRGLIGR